MGVNRKVDPEVLVKLLGEDRYWGRNARIAAILNVNINTVREAVKRLPFVPPFITHSNAESLADYRARIKEETGHSPKALNHVKDPRQLMVKKAKERAKTFKREFDLHPSDIVIPDVCPVLGIPLLINSGYTGNKDQSPSLDRVDNDRGYTWDNVIVISRRANLLKNSATREELTRMANFYNNFQAPVIRNPIESSRRKDIKKLTAEQEARLKEDRVNGATLDCLAHRYNISVTTVRIICRGRPPRDMTKPKIKKIKA